MSRAAGKLLIGLFLVQILGLFAANLPVGAQARPSHQSRVEQQALYEAAQAVENKQYAEAEQILANCISRRQGKVGYRVFLQLGNVYAVEQKPRKALASYEKAVSCNDQDPAVWQNMGKACFDLERFSEAGDYLERAWQLQEEKSPDVLFQAAGCRMMAGQAEKAYDLLEKLCTGDPENVRLEWLQSFAQVCMALDKGQEARQAVYRLLARQPEKPKWWKMLANVDIKAENYNKAAAALKVHNQLVAPGKEDVLRLGDLYMAAGVPAKAAEQYEILLQQDPAARQYEKAASAYLAACRPEKAAAILKQAVKRTPEPRLWHMLGSILYNQDKPEQAFDAFQKSHDLDSDKGESALMMGYSALKAGMVHEAVDAFETAAKFKNHQQAATKGLNAARSQADAK